MGVKAAYARRDRGGYRTVSYRGPKGFLRDALVAGLASNDVNEVQTISSTATGGTFTLTFGAQTTGNLAFNIDAVTLQTALQSLSSIGANNVTVTGGPGPADLIVTFVGQLAHTNVAQMTVDNTNMTGGTATIATTTAGVEAGLKLIVGSYRPVGSGKIVDNVPLATGLKQTGVYYNR